jgi:hypothetical protein
LWSSGKAPRVVVDSLFDSSSFFENEINLSEYLAGQDDLPDDTTVVLIKQ